MKQILIIEDSEVEGLYIQGLMDKMEDVRLTLVKSYDEAEELCKNIRFDLILADFIVPEGNAEEFILSVRGGGYNTETNAVVMGAEDDFEDGEYLDRTGFINDLVKPVEFNRLRTVISM